MDIETVQKVIETYKNSTIKSPQSDTLLEALESVMPVVNAAVSLHEFNGEIGPFGMTVTQELQKVHLFEDYLAAVEELTGIEYETGN